MSIAGVRVALDAGTLVGVVLCLTKGADLLLRPHQENALKRQLESLTLWLSYANPLVYYKSWSIMAFLDSSRCW
jgi:hypothetical protein